MAKLGIMFGIGAILLAIGTIVLINSDVYQIMDLLYFFIITMTAGMVMMALSARAFIRSKIH
jgi:hypothetical protein